MDTPTPNPKATLGFDYEALRLFLELQHRLAAPYDARKPGGLPRGLLMLSRVEVFPTKDQDPIWVNIRLLPGNLQDSLDEIRRADGLNNVNVHFSWHVLRPDLPPRVRGGNDDLVATLALVADFDNGSGHLEGNNFDPATGTIPGLTVAPTAVVETSPGNYQALFIFDTPIGPDRAKPLAEMLWKVAQCDPATRSLTQPWRVPGTVNWPSHKKVKEGRVPVLSRWLKPPGDLVSYEALKVALELAVAALPDEPADDEQDGGEDVLAEQELAKYVAKIQGLKDVAGKNWTVFAAGKRLGRFIAAGRLDEERVVAALLEAVKVWGDPTEPARKAAGTLERGIAAGKRLQPLQKPTGQRKREEVDDNRLAENFVAKYADKVRHVERWGAWHLWVGTHWKLDTRQTVFDAIRRTNLDLRVRSVKKARNTEAFASAFQNIAVEVSTWDRDPYLLGTPGGTVDLRTGRLRPADPNDYITKLTAVTPANVADATTCPRWLQFIGEVTLGDAALMRFLQQWFGYSLTGYTNEQALVFIYGPGGNGKGVLTQVIQYVVGEYGHEAAIDLFLVSYNDKHSTSLAALHGKRLVFTSETEEGRNWAITTIKRLTGGDLITARFMRQDDFTFAPVLKLTVTGNHKPGLPSVGAAERRRFNLVGFNFVPEVVDPDLANTIKAKEAAGVLRWLIDGCVDWTTNRLIRPEGVVQNTKEYMDSQDHYANWIQDCAELKPGTTLGEPTSKLFASWRKYAEERNLRVGREGRLQEELISRFQCVYDKHFVVQGASGEPTEVRGLTGIKLRVSAPDSVSDPWIVGRG
jgi:putative DNA primase/helicase